MTSNPLPHPAAVVSVAMATHNGLRFLPAQLHSILAQLAPGDEVVIVDDASEDGTWDWILAQTDPRVRAVRHPVRLGAIRSFEHALHLADRPIVFLADQDDLWEADKRSRYVSAFEADPECILVIADSRVIDEENRVLADSWMRTRGGFAGGWMQTLMRSRWMGCSMAVRKELLGHAIPIPGCAPMHDMWLGVIATRVGRVAYLDEPLLRYRRHGSNATPSRSRSILSALRHRLGLLCCFVTGLARS
jgi:glycosyltransferase involved in cell wall biosynthesis